MNIYIINFLYSYVYTVTGLSSTSIYKQIIRFNGYEVIFTKAIKLLNIIYRCISDQSFRKLLTRWF